jgi:hypothetical protein
MKLLFLSICLLPISLLHAQLLENPGFEQELKGWQIKEKSPMSSAAESAAREGKAGLHIADESSDSGASLSSERFAANPGQKVTLTFWARATKDKLAAVMIMPYGTDRKAIPNEEGKAPVVIAINESGDWERYEAELVLPAETATFAVSIHSWPGAMGSADLDDFELKLE